MPLPVLDFYQDGQRVDSQRWEAISIDALPAIGFSHPQLQEVALAWAESQGATVLRPAKVVGVSDGNRPMVSVVTDGRVTEFQADWPLVPTGRGRVPGGGYGRTQ